jgi:hypothetical protein
MKLTIQRLVPTIVRYQARLIWRVNLLVAFLVSLLLPLAMFLPDDPDPQFRVYWVLMIVEQFTPLLGVALCSDILSQEWEKHTADLWLVKHYSRGRVVLARFTLAATLTILGVLLVLGQFYLTYVHFDWVEMLPVAIAGALFLGSLGMLTGLVLKNSAASYIIPLGYWAFEMSTKGKYTGILYLFSRTGIVCYETEEICLELARSGPWLASKLLILALSAGLVLVTIFLLQRAGRKGGK